MARRRGEGARRQTADAGAGSRVRITGADAGAAVVEFVFLALLLMVPVVYLVVSLARVQEATFAAQAVARDASRAMVVGGVDALRDGASRSAAERAGREHVNAVTELTLADFRIDDAHVSLACTNGPCLEPGSDVVVDVTVRVSLPVIGPLLPGDAVTVHAASASPVDGYAG